MQMLPTLHTKRQGPISLAFGFGLIVISIISLGIFLFSQVTAPTPRPTPNSNTGQNVLKDNTIATALPFSKPTKVSIPAIDVSSDLITVGKNPDGTIGVPGADNYNRAAWYRHSPSPGQYGSSVIEGHVDFVGKGPAIFFRLGDLQPGDIITVDRQDNTIATFKVDEIAVYDKDTFPTEKVYGITDRSALVLITCGGAFNGTTGEYDSNTVVYSSLTQT